MRAEPGKSPSDIEVLDLNKLNLSNLDLGAFVNLKVLNLRNNRLESLSGVKGLQAQGSFRNLEVLDLRDNQLVDLDEIVNVMVSLPLLTNIGVSGNPIKLKKKKNSIRMELLMSCPLFLEIDCRITHIDDELVSVDELVDVASSISKVNEDQYRWKVAVYRSVPRSTPLDQVTVLDLSNKKLSAKVDFTLFTSLKTLNLSNNLLTSEALAQSNLGCCQDLRALNLGDNRIKDSKGKISILLNSLPSLRRLTIQGNPVCPKDSNENRVKFLSRLACIERDDCPLGVLNDKPISVYEQIDALAEHVGASAMTNTELEEFRTRLAMRKACQDWSSTDDTHTDLASAKEMTLCSLDLKALKPLPMCRSIVTLDISHNKISLGEELEALSDLPYLKTLDIRYNNLPSLTSVITGLELCDSLRVLYMQEVCVM